MSETNNNNNISSDEGIEDILSLRRRVAASAGDAAGGGRKIRDAAASGAPAPGKRIQPPITRFSCGDAHVPPRTAQAGAPTRAPARPASPAEGQKTASHAATGAPREASPVRPVTQASPAAPAAPAAPVRQTPPEAPSEERQAPPVRPTSRPATPAPDDENGETRVTDMNAKAAPSAPFKTSKKSKKKTGASKDDSGSGGAVVSGLLRTVIYLVSVLVVSFVLAFFILSVGNDMFAFEKSSDPIDVEIPEGATKADIASILYENGVIKYQFAFKLFGSMKHIEDNFVPGIYRVTPMMNYNSLYGEFREKPVTGTTWVTIPEGYTIDEIIDLLLSYGIGESKEAYVEAINDKNNFTDFWFVKELDENGYNEDRYYRLEGYLFPDTYEFYNASKPEDVIRKMLRRFSEIYTDKYNERAAEIGLTTDQVVILASMIEKEAGLTSDFRNVSSVFHNRLAHPETYAYLESDATGVYAVWHDTGERPKEVTSEVNSYNSPYNTYLNPGFPPGAIANPGMNAIKYALYPADTGYFYFVSLESGETLFAYTYDQHLNNVAIMQSQNAD